MKYQDYFLVNHGNLTLKEKEDLIRENYKRVSTINGLISDIDKTYFIPREEEKHNDTYLVSVDDSKLNELYNKINLLDVKDLYEEQVIELFQKNLPSNLSVDILSRLKTKLYYDIVTYHKLGLESNLEDLELIKEAIKDLKLKIACLDIEMEEQEIKENTTTDNNVFFLESEMGNIYFLENLRKKVPTDYYEEFLELLQSIKNGTFLGLKYLHRIRYFEVKLFKVRITFSRLANGSYLIMDGFMKKEDTSVKYRSGLENRKMQLEVNQDYYKEHLNDPDFIKEHNAYYNDIVSFLENKNTTLKRGNN